MNKNLTVKQEAFCQAYIKLGTKSAAYRASYSCENMKDETINTKAYILFKKENVGARIQQLQNELKERNRITIDELVIELANMVRFDIADLYNEDGSLKNIHQMPKAARQMIMQLESFEEFSGFGPDKELIGFTKKVKMIPKLDAIEKLMKHLGGYKLDNEQKTTNIFIGDERKQRLEALKNKLGK
jgi:phage terminase small subunit